MSAKSIIESPPGSKNTASATKALLHRLLVHIGDLYRYLDTLGQTNSRILAAKWYNAAILVVPRDGMPFNQLGTLAISNKNELEAAFYYIRWYITFLRYIVIWSASINDLLFSFSFQSGFFSLTSSKAFDGAENNLRAILKKSKTQPIFINSPKQDAGHGVQKCYGDFLAVIGDFWDRCEHPLKLESSMVNSLESIRKAIELPITLKVAPRPSYLHSEAIFRMGAMLLMLIERFKVANESASELNLLFHGASVAFTLNFFYYIANANVKFFDMIKIADVIDSKFLDSNDGHNRFVSSFRLDRSRRKTLFRTPNAAGSTLLSLEDSDLNDLEETALSTIDALEMSSDMSESGSLYEPFEDGDSNNSQNTSEDDQSQPCSQSNSSTEVQPQLLLDTTFTIQKALSLVNLESSLPTIKILCNWLMCNSAKMSQYFDRMELLFGELVALFNLLLEIETKALDSNHLYQKFKCNDDTWKQAYPLSVDLAMIGFRQLTDFQSVHLDFVDGLKTAERLSEDERGFVCIQSVLAFGHYLAQNCFQSNVKFDSVRNRFYIACLTDPDCNQNQVQPSIIGQNHKSNATKSDRDSMRTRQDAPIGVQVPIVRTAFDFENSNFLSKHFAMFGAKSTLNDNIIPNMAHLWLDSNDNQIKQDSKTASLGKPKDFCSHALTSV